LASAVNASSTSFLAKTGEGANFIQPINGNATSGGSQTVLNSTGIQAAGVAVGDVIYNLTDSTPSSSEWSKAVVTAVSANSVTTTRLRGGTDNTWDNVDNWCVNPFVINLSIRTGGTLDGEVTQYEKILITNRSSDTLSIPATSGYRGYDGTTPNTFSIDDFITQEVDQSYLDGLRILIAELYTYKTDTEDSITKDIGDNKGDLIGFSADNVPVKVPKASTDGKYLKSKASGAGGLEWGSLDVVGSFFGDGSDGDKVVSGTENLNLNQIYNFNNLTIPTGQVLTTSDQNGTMFIKVLGDLVIAGKIDLKGKGGVGGTGVTKSVSGIDQFDSSSGNDGTTADTDSIVDGLSHYGKKGSGYANASPSIADGHGSGASGGATDGNSNSTSAAGSAAGAAAATGVDLNKQAMKIMAALVGSGGGSGGVGVASVNSSSSSQASSGDGGNGGGGLVLLVKGSVTFTGGIIDCSGENASVGSANGAQTWAAGAGGSGGGSGGGFIILHQGTRTGTPTVTTTKGLKSAGVTSGGGSPSILK
jgi:hypothetical protein